MWFSTAEAEVNTISGCCIFLCFFNVIHGRATILQNKSTDT
jgi:hypothetical protein